MPKHATILAVNKHLHPVRLATYTSRCGNDPYLALELYKWNLQLSAAFQQVLAVTEVALRNSIDEQLRIWNAGQPRHSPPGGTHGRDWLLDPARPLNSLTRDSRRTATNHATAADGTRDAAHPRKGVPVTHDDILAQITFGVWPKLLPTKITTDTSYRARRILWQQALHHAFPHNTNDPNGYIVADRAGRLHGLRNRVSHMEPLLGVNITARHNDALRLLAAISPEVRDWCAGMSTVIEIRRKCPIEL
ncbi:hypothetical protein R4282_32335 [Rhodococcus oxybenzonivorans]|uniref:hypothetical protein n=1 Tax=Rhodococcus oxybenzonivorans TaxID=1990687 RepID=UPI002955156D|nr:hypothetical protein [Rhodococcus oxybenzonivorans]MDV7357683.1 hypothetical protein [Rhodococcus oxybenzonivorans]